MILLGLSAISLDTQAGDSWRFGKRNGKLFRCLFACALLFGSEQGLKSNDKVDVVSFTNLLFELPPYFLVATKLAERVLSLI